MMLRFCCFGCVLVAEKKISQPYYERERSSVCLSIEGTEYVNISAAHNNDDNDNDNVDEKTKHYDPSSSQSPTTTTTTVATTTLLLLVAITASIYDISLPPTIDEVFWTAVTSPSSDRPKLRRNHTIQNCFHQVLCTLVRIFLSL